MFLRANCRSFSSLARSLVAIVVVSGHVPDVRASEPRVFTYDGGRSDRGFRIVADSGGNWYVPASVERSDGTPSFRVVKHRPDGAVDWVGVYTGTSGGLNGAATAVAVDTAGNVYAAGYVYGGPSIASLDLLVVKFDANGIERWSVRYDGPGQNYDASRLIAIDDAGNIYVAGRSYGSSFDWATLKISSAGSLVWVRRFDSVGPGSDDDPVDLALDATGNPIVMGRAANASGAFGSDVRAIKYSSAGQIVWQAMFTESELSDDAPADMEIDAGGNVWITGQTSATSSPEQPIFPFLVKFSPDGRLDLSLRDAAAGGTALTSDTHGSIYVTGTASPVFATPRSAVTKFSADGSVLWTTPIAEADDVLPVLNAIVVDSTGAPYVAGVAFDRFNGGRDFLTLKLRPGGSILWQHRFNGAGGGNDEVAGLALDTSGNLLVSGTSWGGSVSSGGTSDDIVTLKFSKDAVPSPTTPAAPANLAVLSATASQVALRWEDRSADEAGFRIERCAGERCTNFAAIVQVAAGVTTYRDTSVAKNTKYSYRVVAFNEAGTSAPSNVRTVQTPKK